MSELGGTLHSVEDFEAAAESGVGLSPIPHGFMDLPEDAMRSDLFEQKAAALRLRERFAKGIQGLLVATCRQVNLCICNLCVCD